MTDEHDAADVPGVTGEAVARVLHHIRRSNGYGDDDNHMTGIAEATGMPRQRCNRAVRMLEKYGLVRREREGRRNVVRLNGWDGEEETAPATPLWNQ